MNKSINYHNSGIKSISANIKKGKNSRLFVVLVVFSLFPYFSPWDFGTDTSPLYILILLPLLLQLIQQRRIRLSSNVRVTVFLFCVLFLFSLVVFGITKDVVIIRYSMGYVLFASVLVVSLNADAKRIRKIIIYSAVLWFLFGLFQFVGKQVGVNYMIDFTNYFLSSDLHGRTSSDRGVMSLAPEPSYYGMVIGLFLVFIRVMYKTKTLDANNFMFLTILFVIQYFFALSAVGFITLFIYISSYFVNKNILQFLLLLVSIMAILVIMVRFGLFQDTRIESIVLNVIRSPYYLVDDLSSASRIAAIIAPFGGLFVDNGIIGHLFGDQNEVLKQGVYKLIDDKVVESLLIQGLGTAAKIKSTYGVMIYQFGIVGIGGILLLNYSVYKSISSLDFSTRYLVLAMMNWVLVVQMPLTTPTLPLMLGIIIRRSKRFSREVGRSGVSYGSLNKHAR